MSSLLFEPRSPLEICVSCSRVISFSANKTKLSREEKSGWEGGFKAASWVKEEKEGLSIITEIAMTHTANSITREWNRISFAFCSKKMTLRAAEQRGIKRKELYFFTKRRCRQSFSSLPAHGPA